MANHNQDSTPQLLAFSVQFLHGMLLLLIFLGPTISFTHNRKIQAALSIVVFLLTMILIHRDLQVFDLLIGIYTGILILWTLAVLGTEWFFNRHVYHSIAGLAFALLLKNKKLSRWTIALPFLALSIASILLITIFHENLADGKFYSLNRNSFVKILLVYASLIAIFDFFNGKARPELWPGVLVFIIGALSESRGGLGMSLLYLLLLLIVNLYYLYRRPDARVKLKISRTKLAIIAFLSFVFFLLLAYFVIKDSPFKTKGITSNGRVQIFLSYVNELNLKKLLLGFRPAIYSEYNHMHNSYLTLLALNGIGAIPAFMAIGLLVIRTFKISFLLFGIIGIYCLYSLFEHVFFFNIADYVVISILLITRNVDSEKTQFIDSKLFGKLS
ncbi:MAG: hypothetical protein VB025_08450 [Sphaerochaeta sp.]|nr:hypothetical protein [Sphaerochaeta sp.]